MTEMTEEARAAAREWFNTRREAAERQALDRYKAGALLRKLQIQFLVATELADEDGTVDLQIGEAMHHFCTRREAIDAAVLLDVLLDDEFGRWEPPLA